MYDTAKHAGKKAAAKKGAKLMAKGTAARVSAHLTARAALNHVGGDFEDLALYVLDQFVGPRMEQYFKEPLDPVLKSKVAKWIEADLRKRLDDDTKDWLTELNRRIARRLLEERAAEVRIRLR